MSSSTASSATTAVRGLRKAAPFNILVATAGDEESSAAVRLAALLARRMGGAVEVLTVVTPFPHALPTGLMTATAGEVDVEGRKAAIERVREQLKGVRGTGGWRVHAAIGWPVDSIAAAGRRWDASLIVMGIGEHSILARLVGSETAVGVAKRTSTPVLAVPPDFTGPLASAFAAIDFSDSSIAAARLAARLMPSNGSVTLIHTSIFAKPAAEAGSIVDLYSTGARDRLATIANDITRATHRRVATLIADAPVADAITSAGERGRGGLIALGSHERDLADRLLLGSVRARVIRHAKCPVLVVPQTSDTSE